VKEKKRSVYARWDHRVLLCSPAECPQIAADGVGNAGSLRLGRSLAHLISERLPAARCTAAVTMNSSAAPTSPPRVTKVLFCGEEFPAGCRLVRRRPEPWRDMSWPVQASHDKHTVVRSPSHAQRPPFRPMRQTKQKLASDAGVEVTSCARAAVAEHLLDADVLVPLMCRMDEPLLQAAKRAKLIIQYGVGLEVLCPTCCRPLSSLPACAC